MLSDENGDLSPGSCIPSGAAEDGEVLGAPVAYFLSKIELHRSDAPGMSRWRKQLFLATSHLTADATEYFKLPRAKQ